MPWKHTGEWKYRTTILELLTEALDGGEWLASLHFRFSPWGRAVGTHWVGGSVGPTAGLEAMEKNLLPLPEIEYRLSSP
jgi:hypothetical protein